MDIQKKQLALAVSYINQVMDAECIFCFGARSSFLQADSLFATEAQPVKNAAHFDLLAITTNKCCLPDFIGQLTEIPDMDITVSVMSYPHGMVQDELKKNNRFFHSVISSAKVVYAKRGDYPTRNTGVFDAEADHTATLAFWDTHYSNATTYLDLASTSIHDTPVAIPLLNKSLVQICEGLVFVFMGYHAKNYELKELLMLCNSIDSRLNDLLPQITESDHLNYKLLVEGLPETIYGDVMEPDTDEVHWLCSKFVKLTKELCESRLSPVESE